MSLGELTGWWVDYWTFGHFIEWAVGSMAVCWFIKLKLLKVALMALAVGVIWECLELYVVEKIGNFHEPWYNRWISDLIVDTLGGCFGAVLVRKVQRVLVKKVRSLS
jgi:hypothetical protein